MHAHTRYPGPLHLALALTEALVPVLPQIRAVDEPMARQLRRAALDIARSLTAARLADRPHQRARHRDHARRQATEARMLLARAMSRDPRGPARFAPALACADRLAELLAPLF